MKNNWEVKKLGEICDKITDGTHSTPTYLPEGIPFLSVKNLTKGFIDLSDTRFISIDEHNFLTKRCKPEREDILYTKVGTTGIAKVVDINDEFSIFVSLALLKIKHEIIYNKYLEHFLNAPFAREQAQKRTRGMANKNLVISDIKEIEIHFPKSLAEQQRIVAILDEAFAAIAQAKENAEKNLQNARELFDSYLNSVFANPRDGLEVKQLLDICELIVDCEHKTAPTQKEGFPSIRTPNIGKGKLILENVNRVSEATYKEWTRRAEPQAGDLILAREAPAGNAAVIPENLKVCLGQRTVLIRPNKNIINPYFLAQLLLSKRMQERLLAHSRGATVAHVNMKDIRALYLEKIPSLSEQQIIVDKLKSLSVETQKLENIYRQKISDLDELKKSILQKAFSGELTAKKQVSNVVEFPVRIPNISATDLQAGIVALAFQRHQEKGKVLTFGHVKAEKIVHLSQEVLNIELDRKPVKDAAGPNDFPQLKKVESRAEKAGFFRTVRQGYGYTYIQGNRFDNLIEKTKTALNDKAAELTDLIDLLVPMDTQQAELVATVYASWNNLLIDNQTIDDEAIVFEARENWHEAKLNIPRERFFNTISWMKENNLTPKGKGKKVLAKK